jgi:hypothetical protein
MGVTSRLVGLIAAGLCLAAPLGGRLPFSGIGFLGEWPYDGWFKRRRSPSSSSIPAASCSSRGARSSIRQWKRRL